MPESPAGLASVAVKVAPAAYVVEASWDELYSEAKLRALAFAAAERMRTKSGVFAGAAAGALHRLPLFKMRADRVDVIIAGIRGRRTQGHVVRHHVPLSASEIVEIDGLRVTNKERTVYDLIRAASLEAAVAVFDAALRSEAWDEASNTYDVDAAERFRARVRTRIRQHPGARGIRQARFVTEFADGRGQLPGESVMRLWMWQLGMPSPELQHRVEFDDGTYALLDFAWPALRRWMEFDGAYKYTDPALLEGRTAEDVQDAQERRERRIREATGWRCDRCSFAEMGTFDDFARFMRDIRMFPASS